MHIEKWCIRENPHQITLLNIFIHLLCELGSQPSKIGPTASHNMVPVCRLVTQILIIISLRPSVLKSRHQVGWKGDVVGCVGSLVQLYQAFVEVGHVGVDGVQFCLHWFLLLDGRGGGTGAAPLIFRDHISVPTIAALARAYRGSTSNAA